MGLTPCPSLSRLHRQGWEPGAAPGGATSTAKSQVAGRVVKAAGAGRTERLKTQLEGEIGCLAIKCGVSEKEGVQVSDLSGWEMAIF